jgi:hypothetical protein
MISLIVGTAAGLILNRRSPMPNNGKKQRGQPAISPQSVTGLRPVTTANHVR